MDIAPKRKLGAERLGFHCAGSEARFGARCFIGLVNASFYAFVYQAVDFVQFCF